jgi:hypothetical protein
MNFKEFLKQDESIQFENLGYFVEYMRDSQYLGSINIAEKDREEIGYYGRQDHVAECDIVLNYERVIPKGTHYYTRLYPLCGEWLNKPEAMKQNSLK